MHNEKSRQYHDSYAFALEEIHTLGLVAAEKYLTREIEASRDFRAYNEFDRGIEDALKQAK